VYAFDSERGQYVPIQEAGRGTKQEAAPLSRRRQI
jgi:hypothetical protein